jgi:dephospho-CoA kinase
MAKLKYPLKLKQKYITLDERTRLYGLSLPIIGLTGGIASGKSTVSNLLKDKGFNIIDADALIHEIYRERETIAFIQNISPESIDDGLINFTKLREAFFSNKETKSNIEQFLYKKLPSLFLRESKVESSNFVIYDVPLLFEKSIDVLCDISVTVYSTRENQLKRLKLRDGSSNDSALRILSSQLNIEIKKEKSTYVIDNNGDIRDLNSQIQVLIDSLFE